MTAPDSADVRAREWVYHVLDGEHGMALACSECENRIAAALAEAEARGREAGLEEAAKLCPCDEAWTSRDRHAPECIVDEIRALRRDTTMEPRQFSVPLNKSGCKPVEDVCVEHDLPLACRHGCRLARCGCPSEKP